MPIASRIRSIPDYPVPGTMFRDVTTLLKDPVGLRVTINEPVNRYSGLKIEKVAGIEARGFILGAALAHTLGVGFVLIRKKGKLPAETVAREYDLEYGTDIIEIHKDAISEGGRLLLVNDLIATGGTAEAAIELIQILDGEIIECGFLVGLPELGGRQRFEGLGQNVFVLCEFEG